jgi:serine protease Do
MKFFKKYSSRFFFLLTAIILVIAVATAGAGLDRYFSFSFLDRFFPRTKLSDRAIVSQRILNEESRVIEVVERFGPSVVTVSISKKQIISPFRFEVGPFGIFGPGIGQEENIEQDIGSGFVVAEDGLVVTNRHVVDDPDASYKVITTDDREHKVTKIYRDPVNDLAILQIEANGLKPVELGDSSELKVGQFVIAIGTALGEFRNTVTTGVISGLGRGITAGSPFEGYVEQIDDVIQTDAAINPGNSGGPLLNSLGQVIGINVAIAAAGENIGFAIPINVVKESLDNFNRTGKFSRPFLGVRYQMISRDVALMNEVPQGAYIIEVVADTPAEKAGVQEGDIITKFDNQPVRQEEGGLANLINQKKVGDRIILDLWRDGEEVRTTVVLEEFEG